ncbi:MAG: hypothetical protein ACK56F_12130, partial [bacterium]
CRGGASASRGVTRRVHGRLANERVEGAGRTPAHSPTVERHVDEDVGQDAEDQIEHRHGQQGAPVDDVGMHGGLQREQDGQMPDEQRRQQQLLPDGEVEDVEGEAHEE